MPKANQPALNYLNLYPNHKQSTATPEEIEKREERGRKFRDEVAMRRKLSQLGIGFELNQENMSNMLLLGNGSEKTDLLAKIHNKFPDAYPSIANIDHHGKKTLVVPDGLTVITIDQLSKALEILEKESS